MAGQQPDVEMGEISQAKDPKGGGGADNWLSDGGNGEAAPSSGPAETKVAVSQVADDWLSDGHSGAPGGNQEAANKEGLNGDTEGVEHGPNKTGGTLYGINDHDFWVGTSSAMMWLVYVLMIILISCVLWQYIMYPFETHVAAWTLGAVFVALSVPLSLQDIHMHILHYISPLQRHYIRILWMVPIYAVESWLALRFNEQKVYLETLREAYEAFVVYSLYKLMREFMGDKPMAVAKLARIAEKKGSNRATMLFPLCWSYAWRLDAQFLTRSSLGVWQYVFIRTGLASTACILEMNHMYGEGSFAFDKFYVWNVIILNLSQCWALWCLVLFYHELKDELAPIQPLGKFMVVKAVVFFSWWQQIIVTYLASAEVIHPMMDYTGEDVAKGIQNLLVCIEMLIYALFHKKFFSYTDFRAGGPLTSYMESMDLHQKAPKTAMTDMIPADVIMEGASYVVKAKRLVDNSDVVVKTKRLVEKSVEFPMKIVNKQLHWEKHEKDPKTPKDSATGADAAHLDEIRVDIGAEEKGASIGVVPDLLMMEPNSTTSKPAEHKSNESFEDDEDFDPGEGINPFDDLESKSPATAKPSAEVTPADRGVKKDGNLLVDLM